MREKLYSKFTKERRMEFQLETSIWQQDGKRSVVKRALFTQGRKHLENMLRSYEKMSHSHGLLIPCRKIGADELEFDFCRGKSMADRLLELLQDGKTEAFLQEIFAFPDFIVDSSGDSAAFEPTPESEAMFGILPENLKGEKAVVWGNVDITFDNIIENDKGKTIIDYEWILPFPVPVSFIWYRVIGAFFDKFGGVIHRIVKRDQVLEAIGFEKEACRVYEEMNLAFIRYVYGGEYGYQSILKQYEQETGLFWDPFAKRDYAQIYFDHGAGYSEKDSIFAPVEVGTQLQNIKIPLNNASDIREIRFDPCFHAAIVKMEQVTVRAAGGKTLALQPERAGTGLAHDRTYVFLQEDPQIIYKVKRLKHLEELELSFRLLQFVEIGRE